MIYYKLNAVDINYHFIYVGVLELCKAVIKVPFTPKHIQ